MKIGAIVPQGWVGEYDGWDAARRVAANDRGRPPGRPARVRVDLAVRPLPHRPAADRRDHLRVVHLAGGAGRDDRAGPPRPHRHLHRLPQPGADGQDDLDDGLDQRRPDGARDRRRLEARRVAGLRLRLPGDEGAAGTPGRRPRRHQPRCSPATSTSTRRTRAGYARVSDAINVPKPIQQPRVPIMVGGNGPNVTWRLAARHADELNLDGMTPAEVGGRAAGHRRPLRGDRPRPGQPACVGPRLGQGRSGSAGRLGSISSAPIRDAGVSRVMGLVRASATTDDALESLAEDARAAGVELA